MATEFEVGDRVRVGAAAEGSARFNGGRGVIYRRARDPYNWCMRFAGGRTGAFYSRELEPLTEVWKVVTQDKESVFASRANTYGPTHEETTLLYDSEAERCTAFTTEYVARLFAEIHSTGECDYSALHVYRAEAVMDAGAIPNHLVWNHQAGACLSVRHLMLVERVAVYRNGKEVVMEDPWVRRVADALACDVGDPGVARPAPEPTRCGNCNRAIPADTLWLLCKVCDSLRRKLDRIRQGGTS